MPQKAEFMIFAADCIGNVANCLYPHTARVIDQKTFRLAISRDHVCAEYRGGYRSEANFIKSDCLPMDCDNDHSDSPTDWKTPQDVATVFPGVPFAYSYSRNHMKPKSGKAPRPKFHCYFLITEISEAKQYAYLKKAAFLAFPFFDSQALDAARFIFGTENTEVGFIEGDTRLDAFLRDSCADISESHFPNVKDRQVCSETSRIIPEGQRNSTLNRFSLQMLMKYGDTPEVWAAVAERNEREAKPPLEDGELQTLFASAQRKYHSEIENRPDYIQPSEYVTQNFEWSEITPIDTLIPPELPLDCYPVTIGNFARALSEYTQTDPAMSGVILLGLLGTLFQNKISVVSVNGNVEQPSIYAVAIAPPAERKSEVIRHVVNPLNKFVNQYNMERRAEISRSKAERKLREKALAKAEKGDDTNALFRAQEALDSFKEIQPLTLVADDTTVEALISLMAENGERMLIASDEGGIFTHMKGRYKQNGDDTELYLKAYSGGRVSVHRKSREPDVLESPALSLCLAVQPFVVENSILDEENNGRGLTARFIYVCCEERAGKRRAISGEMPTEIVAKYEDSVKKCLSKTINSEAFLENDYSSVGLVHLSEDAREFAIQYFTVAERRIAGV
jgi:hypothetical protein